MGTSIVASDKLHHLIQRRAREKYFVRAVSLHPCRIRWSNRATASAEKAYIGATFAAQVAQHLGKEFYVPAVVGGKANGPHILLDSCPHNVANRTMIAQIHDF